MTMYALNFKFFRKNYLTPGVLQTLEEVYNGDLFAKVSLTNIVSTSYWHF